MPRTLADCLAELAKGGEISDAEYRRIRDAFEGRRAQKRMALGDDEAARAAAAELEADMKAEAIEKKRRAALDARVGFTIKERLQNFRRPDGKSDINEASLRLVQNIEHRKHAIEGQARALLADQLDTLRRTKLTGRQRNPILVDEAIKAWHGDQNVSPEARTFAAALDRTFEFLRQRENDAGAAIGRLENWGGPHWHDPRALRAAGFDTWKAAIFPKLDAAKTGLTIAGREWSRAELEAALPRMFERITTEGWNEREPLMRPVGLGSLAGRHNEPRMLHFKSGEDWLSYNRDFGAGTPFNAIMRAISVRARDIAAMELLGPNPDGRTHWLRQLVTKHGAEAAAGRPSLARHQGERAVSKAASTVSRIDAMWANIKGESTTPVSTGWAESIGTLRSLNVASKLGRAFLSSLGDLGTQKLARMYNQIGGSVAADIVHYLASYRMSRDEAARAGLLIDSTIKVFHEQARHAKAWNIRGMADYLADRVLALSALTPWTEAGRHAFGFSFYAEVADHAGKGFDALPAHLREAMQRHNIDAGEWNIIREAAIHKPDASLKSGMIRPADVLELSQGQFSKRVQTLLKLTAEDETMAANEARKAATEIATKYHEMVLAETEYAVPTSTVRARTVLTGKTRPGTLPGELLRAPTQFRSYPLVLGMLWGQRIADDLFRGQSWSQKLRGAEYAVGLFTTLTLLGAMSVQLKNLAAGRDPENMNPATPEGRKFMTAAFQQGGGFGIFSDFVFADQNRYGNSMAATWAGPIAGDVEDALKIPFSTVQTMAQGKETNAGRQFARLLQNNMPGGNLWYLNAAGQRLLFNNLQRLLDPKAEEAFRRQIRNRQRERNQGFWWAPGENAPARAPELGAMWRQ